VSKLESFIHYPYVTNLDLLEQWQNTLKMLALNVNQDVQTIGKFKKLKFHRAEKPYSNSQMRFKSFFSMFPIAVVIFMSWSSWTGLISYIETRFSQSNRLNRFVFHDDCNNLSSFDSEFKQRNIQGKGNCLKVTERNRLIWQRFEDTSEEIDEILSEHFMLDTFFQQGFT